MNNINKMKNVTKIKGDNLNVNKNKDINTTISSLIFNKIKRVNNTNQETYIKLNSTNVTTNSTNRPSSNKLNKKYEYEYSQENKKQNVLTVSSSTKTLTYGQFNNSLNTTCKTNITNNTNILNKEKHDKINLQRLKGKLIHLLNKSVIKKEERITSFKQNNSQMKKPLFKLNVSKVF